MTIMKKTAVVTGGSGGIGQAIVEKLARNDYQVIAFYCHQKAKAFELQAKLLEQGQRIDIAYCDLRSPLSVHDAFTRIYSLYHHIDLLVCAQGVASIRLFTDTDEEEWNRIMDINLNGTYRAVHAALPDMISRKTGSVITISSMWGEVGASCEAAYSASKAGVIGLTKALAKELGPSGIRVNCVSPGVIQTAMNQELTSDTMTELSEETPLGRLGLPEEVADAVLFLASHEASFITGQVLGVSGGFVI